VIGGMISSMLLTLIVIPAIFGLVKAFRLPKDCASDALPPRPVTSVTNETRHIREPAQ
jgi:copper/silver efflux system protein